MLHLTFTQRVSEDLRSNVKVLKNARSKARAEKNQAEDQKFKQVTNVYRTKNTACNLQRPHLAGQLQLIFQNLESASNIDAFTVGDLKHSCVTRICMWSV